MRARRLTAAAALFLIAGAAACSDDDDDDVSVELTAPEDGATVAGGVALVMTAEGITIEPAGAVSDGAGHFHVIADDGCVAAGETVPEDADHVHLGEGQADGVIYLEPGRHELCLQVADGAHTALDATDRVTVEVGVTDRDGWCEVVGAVDELFEATDNSGDEFAVKQVGYENIRRLLAQLSAAIDIVDADVRDDVHASLAFGANVAGAFVGAADEEAAGEAVEALREGVEPPLPGAAWIDETCGVDIDG